MEPKKGSKKSSEKNEMKQNLEGDIEDKCLVVVFIALLSSKFCGEDRFIWFDGPNISRPLWEASSEVSVSWRLLYNNFYITPYHASFEDSFIHYYTVTIYFIKFKVCGEDRTVWVNNSNVLPPL